MKASASSEAREIALPRSGWILLEKTDFAMHARTSIENKMLSRRETEAPPRASTIAARPTVLNRKNTQNAAELKPAGRVLAKDSGDFASVPLMMKTLLENGQLYGDCTTVAGRTIAENLKSVKSNLRHGLARRAPGGAIEDAAMSEFAETGLAVGGPSVLLRDGDIKAGAVAALIINGNLTGLRLAERQTKRQLRQTNDRSGARWKFAQEVGPAVDGAVTRSGGAHEQCYADN